ncbi:cysteine-rich CWC family protein [uncultured Mucilaginibacter sp.]|uniref:cysteine-rich CWC family protein n=1 Tax=uncultured Mucilaginibacter sp. TaxID=797541 RepID=UPI0025F5C5CE|nr:cysteine-rich CWC family protein [uncultured Mucilaginibacter sp.]
MSHYPKHEIIACDRCGTTFECKANSFTKCQCTTVQLNLNETQYISELFDGCLCAKCLAELKQEYIARYV